MNNMRIFEVKLGIDGEVEISYPEEIAEAITQEDLKRMTPHVMKAVKTFLDALQRKAIQERKTIAIK